MKNVILFVKGFVMGIANIIPGVSGGTLAITLGIYEKFISAISNFFSNIKDNLKFLIPVFLGMGVSILSMSNLISYSFKKIPFITTLFFMGLVVGGIPMIFKNVNNSKELKKTSNYIIALLTFSLVIILALSDYIFGSGLSDVKFSLNVISLIKLMIVGVIAASTMIIPGISGSLVLMLLGYYLPVINAIKELTHFDNIFVNLVSCGFFGIGVLIGIVLVAKLIEWLFKNQKMKTYFGVLGFIIASVIAIPISVIREYGKFTFSFGSVIIAVVMLIVGMVIGYKLGDE